MAPWDSPPPPKKKKKKESPKGEDNNAAFEFVLTSIGSVLEATKNDSSIHPYEKKGEKCTLGN